MFRVIFYLLLTVAVISVLKSIVGIFLSGISQAMKGASGAPGARSSSQASNQVPLTGELKKDPVCGTYVAAASSIKETVAGQTIHFCSAQCRDKFVATLAR
jgi:YHS domain-containing protein